MRTIRAALPWLLIIVAFFIAFFWRVFFTGVHFVTGDALVYAMPMRAAAWEMLRRGELPLWTPTLMSGYPLLSMASLGLGYPLTWFYAVLPDYLAEELYVLAPFLLSPMLMYAYLRTVGRSQCAALLGGLSFGYSGYMAGGLSHNGMLMNAVMWLPLLLVALERSRRDETPWTALLLAAVAYSLSVLTGLGQGFLWVAMIAGAYAICLSLSAWSAFRRSEFALNDIPPEDGTQNHWHNRWRPLFIVAGAFVLAVGVGAFQILETMQFQRLSIRGKLSYAMFSGGAFDWRTLWQNFSAPLYHFNHEMTAFVAPFAVVLALVATIHAAWGVLREAVASWRSKPHAKQATGSLPLPVPPRNWRIWFWFVIALLGLLLMQGDGTPLYRWLYHVPAVNLFRVPWRHAYEWSLGLTMLAAFGWDALVRQQKEGRSVSGLPRGASRSATWHAPLAFIITLFITAYAAAHAWQPAPKGATTWTAMPESHWLWWKLSITLGLLVTLWLARKRNTHRAQTPFFICLIFVACFWEQAVVFHHWGKAQHRSASFYTQLAPATKFLLQQPQNTQRAYTSMAAGFVLDLPKHEPHNLSARRGLANAAGYEPLMWKRYADVFGTGLNFATPNASAPFDAQTFTPHWQALDLLNVRYLAEFGAAQKTATVERFGARFAQMDQLYELSPGAHLTFGGNAQQPADTLTVVSALANAGELAQGQPVAQLTFHQADGTTFTRELKAGIDTAEWAHERADVKANIQHALAPTFDSRAGDAANSFLAYRYWTKFTLPTQARITRIELHNITARATLLLSQALLYANADNSAQLLTRGLPAHWQTAAPFDGVTIYENPRAFPRIWLTAAAVSATPAQALACVRDASITGCDLRNVTLLEAPATTLAQAHIPAQTNATMSGEALFERYENQHLVVRVKATAPSVLVLSEINLPGWTATLDGQPVRIYPANYLLRGVLIPAGEHRVEMRYTSRAFRLGAVITLVALVLLAGVTLLAARERSFAFATLPNAHRQR